MWGGGARSESVCRCGRPHSSVAHAPALSSRFVQLGLLTVIPLTVLYAIEAGVLTALWRVVKMMLTLGPVFFMFEIQTKVRRRHHWGLPLWQRLKVQLTVWCGDGARRATRLVSPCPLLPDTHAPLLAAP